MKEDTESLEIFQNEVARQLISEKGRRIKVFIYILSLCIFLFSPPLSPLQPLNLHVNIGVGGISREIIWNSGYFFKTMAVLAP